jgi:UDP-3-O-[3-hydroxymyristoyl] glucosamine N-acyltransferase
LVTPATITELAQLTRARLIGDGSAVVSGVASLSGANSSHLCFVRSPGFASEWATSKGAAAIVSATVNAESVHDADPLGRPLLVVPDADLALIAVLTRFAPPPLEPRAPGVHPSSFVHASARIAATAHIGPGCTVMAAAVVGDHAVLVAQVHVGEAASVGASTRLEPGVRVLDRCSIGTHCILHGGVVIGADGFGYSPAPDGRGLIKVPHIGNVVIHDHVEIGANSCIDRAKFGSTIIGMGTKIDNLVQIGHGCVLGRFCILCGTSGLAGSVTLGDGVVLGGGVAVVDNVTIGSGAKIGGLSGVGTDVPANTVYMGIPAGPASEWKRTQVALRGLWKMMPQLRRLLKSTGNEL